MSKYEFGLAAELKRKKISFQPTKGNKDRSNFKFGSDAPVHRPVGTVIHTFGSSNGFVEPSISTEQRAILTKNYDFQKRDKFTPVTKKEVKDLGEAIKNIRISDAPPPLPNKPIPDPPPKFKRSSTPPPPGFGKIGPITEKKTQF